MLGELDRLLLPNLRQPLVLKLGHDKAGHFGHKFFLHLLKRLLRMSREVRSTNFLVIVSEGKQIWSM